MILLSPPLMFGDHYRKGRRDRGQWEDIEKATVRTCCSCGNHDLTGAVFVCSWTSQNWACQNPMDQGSVNESQPSLVELLLLTVSGGGTATVFSRVSKWWPHKTPVCSSKPLATQTGLVKFSGSQNGTKDMNEEKGITRVEVQKKKMSFERIHKPLCWIVI